MSCIWDSMVKKIFTIKARTKEERFTLRRRVDRELKVKNFIQQAILTRKLVKDNTNADMYDRLKLDYDSSDDEAWGTLKGDTI